VKTQLNVDNLLQSQRGTLYQQDLHFSFTHSIVLPKRSKSMSIYAIYNASTIQEHDERCEVSKVNCSFKEATKT